MSIGLCSVEFALVRAGDRGGGAAYARAAFDALPMEKHSLTLRMLMTEVGRF